MHVRMYMYDGCMYTCRQMHVHVCMSLRQPLSRFYLSCYQVEEMDNSGHWLPNQDLLWQCGQIFLAEVAIDVAKHAVVGKFNEIRPGVYREFMKVTLSLCLSVCACGTISNFRIHCACLFIIQQNVVQSKNKSSQSNIKAATLCFGAAC